MDSIFLAAATVAGAMMRDHNAPAEQIARRAWDVTAALAAEGRTRGYNAGDSPAQTDPQFAEMTRAAQEGFAGTGLPLKEALREGPEGGIGGVPNETPRRQRTGSAAGTGSAGTGSAG